MDLFHCVYKIELVEFREKVDVAVEIAKSMQELIIFYTQIKKLLMSDEDKFETSAEFGSKQHLYKGMRFNCRISQDYTM